MLLVVSTENLKTLKYHTFSEKHFSMTNPSMICSKCDSEDEKIIKEEESNEILRVLGLIENI